MSPSLRWTAGAAIVVLATACARGIEVRTMVAPEASLASLHTFRMLPAPARRDGRPVNGDDDPMISNSIANRALRDRITKAFQDRGYTIDERNADFVVAFYATAREKLDVGMWDYGYPMNPGWPRIQAPVQSLSQYTEGSVVIDVVKPGSRALLWRGEGKAELSDGPADYVKQLAKTAESIVSRFPSATARVVAVGQ